MESKDKLITTLSRMAESTTDSYTKKHLILLIEGLKSNSQQSQQGGWISVEDRLPEYGVRVLVRGEGKGMNPQMGGAYTFISERLNLKGTLLEKQAERHVEKNHFRAQYVTHWMPLPPPPNSQPIPKKDKLKELEEWARKGTVKCTLGIIANDKYKLGYNGALTDLLSKIQELKNK